MHAQAIFDWQNISRVNPLTFKEMDNREQILKKLFDVTDKVACVTGASSGLGRHAANVLAQSGASVVGIARRQDALQDWQRKNVGKVAFEAHDLGDETQLEKLANKVAEHYGPPDILVHAAGLNNRVHADNINQSEWQQTLWLNLSVPFFLSQHFVPYMKAKNWGRIVNFASLQTFRAFPNGISYGASKGGIGQMTRAMAEAWSSSGININAIGPGFFPTELTEQVFNDPERAERNAKLTCIGRNGRYEDLNGPLLFLCSEASVYVTGQIIMLDGGFTAK